MDQNQKPKDVPDMEEKCQHLSTPKRGIGQSVINVKGTPVAVLSFICENCWDIIVFPMPVPRLKPAGISTMPKGAKIN